ncbi:unnamed protein product [Brassicogethes aeneus]|uniref:ADAM cysteine-rich domain-containing protein n=1 Tax=Brassicogethes aeneus TaxID=1431903 RepID=A0A9P0FEZ8_BRAAE|nr:unnamed protein product [Brassicogethes aeneus]
MAPVEVSFVQNLLKSPISLEDKLLIKKKGGHISDLRIHYTSADCLNDEPKDTLYPFRNVLPGTIYDTDAQCSLLLPKSYGTCSSGSDNFCELLVCRVSPTTCWSKDEPVADGTKCGENKWCYRKECIEIGERPEAVNGGWGEWSSWTSCSRTCGMGVSIAERDCNNPAPQNRGRYCLGERKKTKTCNPEAYAIETLQTHRYLYRNVWCFYRVYRYPHRTRYPITSMPFTISIGYPMDIHTGCSKK